MGVGMPLLGYLGLVSVDHLIDLKTPTPPPSTTLAWRLRAAYVFMAIMFASPLFYLVATGIAVKMYPRGARKRRRAVMQAIRQTEDAARSHD